MSTRSIGMEVAFYHQDATLIKKVSNNDYIKTAKITRQGENNKFFGFGIYQKMNVHLVDIKKKLDIKANDYCIISFYNMNEGQYPRKFFMPIMDITEVRRNDTNNELSITAYDRLYKTKSEIIADLNITPPYTIRQMIEKIAEHYNFTCSISERMINAFDLEYPIGANLQGDESVREVLTMIAEATQTIFYLHQMGQYTYLRFNELGKDTYEPIEITTEDYFEFKLSENRRLSTIQSVNELGDNYAASTTTTGTTQYIRDNAFLEMRDDVQDILDAAIAKVGGSTMAQFSLSWRGALFINPNQTLLVSLRNGLKQSCILVDDVIDYDGSFSEYTQWKYTESGENIDTPAYIGDIVKQTSAKVDKVKQEIVLNAEKTQDNRNSISQLIVSTSGIQQKVEANENNTNKLSGELEKLNKTVETKMDAESVNIQINSALEKGVNKVTTSTGFTFNEQGLTVAKAEREMTTTISEDGMTVRRYKNPVLIANNEGVKAEDLHATTYLIIGKNSRLEDYLGNKTACFWLGGV